MVLTVTILPIKQVGNMLFNNQWTEELNDHSEQQIEKKSQPDKWTFLTDNDLLHSNGDGISDAERRFYSFSQSLPINPSGEIHSPPPNLPA
jgi:hypothetical protein